MNHTEIIITFGIICLIGVACAGCTGSGPGNANSPVSPGPSGTPVQAGNIVVTEAQNGATTSVTQESTITVRLEENPTTGYMWNMTTTSGLQMINDTYEPSDTSGTMVGSGGTRTWEISAAAKGDQKITAVYRRSWEPVTGNETGFFMTVIVQ